MNKTLSRFILQLKTYARTPAMIRLWIIMATALAAVTVNAFFVPTYFLVITVVIAITLGFATISLNLRLSGSIMEMTSKKQQFDSLIENLKDGVIVYDTNFKVLTMNRAAEGIFQVTKEEVVGKYIDPGLVKSPYFRVITQIIFPSLAPTVTQVSEAGTWPQIANIVMDGPKMDLNTVTHRVTDDKGNVTGFLKVVKDRTREKAILESKSEFINVTAHQLRTPLTALNWSMETLAKMTENDQNANQLIKESQKLTERSLKIVNDLLDVSKIEEGKFGYNFEEVDLVDFVKNVVESTLTEAKQYSVRVYFDAQGAGPVTVHIDPSRLSMALLNFIDNAIRYNVKDGKVVVTVERLSDKPFAKVSVQDSGIGINENDLSKLFGKFYRGGNAVQLEPNGNGLGLFIVKNILKRHGGEVGAESAINRGSTFWFTLPLDPKLIPPKETSYEENF